MLKSEFNTAAPTLRSRPEACLEEARAKRSVGWMRADYSNVQNKDFILEVVGKKVNCV